MGHQLSDTAPNGAKAKENNGVEYIMEIKKMHGARKVCAAPPWGRGASKGCAMPWETPAMSGAHSPQDLWVSDTS